MKKFTKMCLWIAIISCAIGISFIIIGATTGGLAAFIQAVDAGEFNYQFGNLSNQSDVITTYTYKSNEKKESYSYELDKVREFSLDIVGAEVYLHNTTGEQITVDVVSNDFVEIELEKGALSIDIDYTNSVIKGSLFSFLSENAPVRIDIYMPFENGFVLEEFDATVTGAVLYIEEVQTKDMDVELVGGEIEITGDFTGEADLEVVAGNLNIKTARSIESYNYRIDGAASNVKIGTNTQSVLAENSNILYHEEIGSTFYIDCTAGNIEIKDN